MRSDVKASRNTTRRALGHKTCLSHAFHLSAHTKPDRELSEAYGSGRIVIGRYQKLSLLLDEREEKSCCLPAREMLARDAKPERNKEQSDEKFNDEINKGKIEQNEKRNNWRRRLGKPDTSAKVYQLKEIHCFVPCNPISSRRSYAGLRNLMFYFSVQNLATIHWETFSFFKLF